MGGRPPKRATRPWSVNMAAMKARPPMRRHTNTTSDTTSAPASTQIRTAARAPGRSAAGSAPSRRASPDSRQAPSAAATAPARASSSSPSPPRCEAQPAARRLLPRLARRERVDPGWRRSRHWPSTEHYASHAADARSAGERDVSAPGGRAGAASSSISRGCAPGDRKGPAGRRPSRAGIARS